MLHYGYIKVTTVENGKVSSRLVESREFTQPFETRRPEDRLIEREEILEFLAERQACNGCLRGHSVCW